jgi:hypothetical protein
MDNESAQSNTHNVSNAGEGSAPQGAAAQLMPLELLLKSWSIFQSQRRNYLIASAIVLLGSILSLGLLAPPLIVGFIRLVDAHCRGESVEAESVLDGFRESLRSLSVGLLVVAGAIVGGALLILPGLGVSFLWFWALHRVALSSDKPTECLRSSQELVSQDFSTMLLFFTAFWVMLTCGALIIFGILFSLPLAFIWITLAYRELYA